MAASYFAGRELTPQPPHVIARAGVGYVPEDRQVFPEHSVEDNLIIAAKKGPDGRAIIGICRESTSCFPMLATVALAPGRSAFRRRAADAGDRPDADGQSDRAAAR